MSKCYKFFGQPVHDPFGAAVQFGGNSLRQRGNLRDAHLCLLYLVWVKPSAPLMAPTCRRRERSRTCEVPYVWENCRFFLPSHCGLADAISLQQVFADASVAKLLRSDGCIKES